MTKPVRRRRRWVLGPLIGLGVLTSILAGVAVIGIPLADRFVPEYQDVLVSRLEHALDADIQIGGLSLGVSRQGPMVYLNDLAITHHGESEPAITADRAGLAFSLLDLISGQYVPDGIRLDGPKLAVTIQNGRPGLAHWPRGNSALTLERLTAFRRYLGELIVDDGQLTVIAPQLPGGRAQWQSLDVDIAENAPDVLEASLSADGPDWWSAVAANARLSGDLAPTAQARFHLSATGLRPARLLRAATGHEAAATSGTTDLTLDGRWRERGLADTTLTVDQAPITRETGAPDGHGDHDRDGKTTIVPGFSKRLTVQASADDPQVRITSADTADTPGLRIVASLADQTVQATAHDLSAERLAAIARWWRPDLAATRLTGRIPMIEVAGGLNQPWHARADFAQIVVGNDRYRIGPLGGRLTHTAGQNTLVFDGAQGQIVSERYLSEPLALTDLGGRVSWHPSGHRTRFDLDDLRLASREARLSANGHVTTHAGEAPDLDLDVALSAPDIPRLLDRLPQDPDLPNPKLRDWLDQAITAGTLDKGQISIRGPADRFPFADPRSGERFDVTLAGHDLDIRYKPGWPALEQTTGRLTLSGATLDAAIGRGRINGVAIDRATAHVPDVREPVLAVNGQVKNAPAPQMLSFLSHSPLSDKFGALLKAIDVAGPADLALRMSLPLKPELGDIAVDGQVTARGNTLTQDYLPAPIRDIRGRLNFDETGLVARDLAGRINGVALTADVLPAPGNRQRIVARATPHLPEDRSVLSKYLPPVWLGYIDGTLPLNIAFSVGGHGAISPIEITSDLAGTAVNLPAPADKRAETTRAARVIVDPDKRRITADIDKRIHVDTRLAPDGGPERMLVRLGERGKTLSAPSGHGLWVGGEAERVEAKGWFDVVRHVLYEDSRAKQHTAGQADTAAAGDSFSFLGGDINTRRLAVGDRYVAGPAIRAVSLVGEPGWRINVDGADSQGQATYTTGPSPQQSAPIAIAANFKRLRLQTDAKEQQAEQDVRAEANPDSDTSSLMWPDLSPDNLPALSVYVADFEVDDTVFGQLQANARVTDNGWSLDQLMLSGGALTGRIAADWQVQRDITTAGASARLKGRGLAQLIRTFGFAAPVSADKTRIDARLSIAPNVAGLDLLHLNGNVDLAMDDGSLLSVEPGPGRLLGLFNLYVLPRRLTLNFRDVVDKGLAFDKARAKFLIRNGQAFSKNAMVVTPSSNIEITGRVGLATRDYDERVSIQPKLGSGVAIASAVLGGPAVGAAVFAVQKLLEKPLSDISAVSYRLKGSWDDPQIIEPHAEGRPADDPPDDDEAPAG